MKLPTLSEERKLLLIFSIAGMLILYLDIYFVLKPQATLLFRLFPEIKKISSNIKLAKRDVASVETLSSQYYGLKEKSNEVSRKIILEEEMPLLLEDISQLANKNNIKIMEISPLFDQKAKEVASISPKDRLYPFSIVIETTSSYHKLGRFLNDVENMERFLKIHSFEITPLPTDYLRHRVKLTLGTFIIRK